MRCVALSSPTSSRVALALLKSFIFRIICALLRDARHRFDGCCGNGIRRRNLQPASSLATAGPEAVVMFAHRQVAILPNSARQVVFPPPSHTAFLGEH